MVAATTLRGHEARPRVPYVALAAQYEAEASSLLPRLERVLASGSWVGGEQVEAFEKAIARRLGVAHAVALNSGTDALWLGLRALGIGPGDEVITPPNSFIATTAAIVLAGATPVFADVLPDQNVDPRAVARAVTPRTRAILPVHLTGRVAPMRELLEVAARHELLVVEDAAQAVGAKLGDRHAGTFGQIGCFSAHPLKNLNAAGDAGFVVTDRADVAERLRRLRNHGLVDRDTALEWGTVSRLDPLQAAVLLHRLEGLDEVVRVRRANAALYAEGLAGLSPVFVPRDAPDSFSVFHTFVVQVERRDALAAFLRERGVETAVHYRRPIHLQPAAAALGHAEGSLPVAEAQAARILSLPIHQQLRALDVAYVCDCIREFYA
jgi:dTDP-4-amino-4,6-dideoxygalactose transaminase